MRGTSVVLNAVRPHKRLVATASFRDSGAVIACQDCVKKIAGMGPAAFTGAFGAKKPG